MGTRDTYLLLNRICNLAAKFGYDITVEKQGTKVLVSFEGVENVFYKYIKSELKTAIDDVVNYVEKN